MKHYALISLLLALVFSGDVFSQDSVSITSSDTAYGGVFALVEKESTFPGGREGWINFLTQNLVYPAKAQKRGIQGTVIVQFIVNPDGSLTDIEAISGPEELRGAAVKAMKKSPKWIPAEQSGRKVKSYKKQPIAFRL
jgi:protein TonB